MTFLDKYIVDKESAQDKMSRVNYEKQRQGYEPIKDYPRYLINDQLTVWDTKLDREVNPQSKKSRSGGLIGRQIRLNDINGKRYDLSFSYLVAKQFIPNEDINKNKIFHLDNDLENDTVDNLLWINNNQQQFVQLVIEPEFEITTTQPWKIRRIADGFEPSINQKIDGYMQVTLNNRTYGLRRLVALQFIPNDDPEHKTQCDHQNHRRSDNQLTNLRWVTVSQNNLNKGQIHRSNIEYVYVDVIDDECIVVNELIIKFTTYRIPAIEEQQNILIIEVIIKAGT
ncbi:MAG: hypothetical protein EZS28_019193 [Streblomastix strix]|uniref:HNH nuclease domain-containing protein n=1 Tax=Streblomastix strix TaxID=222440 RepID=A0A5J4VRT2_9EUKA|nr:MAG: hypothetical protein EZS28_019193 [Streblomastix strix]